MLVLLIDQVLGKDQICTIFFLLKELPKAKLIDVRGDSRIRVAAKWSKAWQQLQQVIDSI